MAYQRLVYTNEARGPENKEAIHVRDIEKMIECTDEEILDKYGVAPEADTCPVAHENVSVPYATGSVHRSVSSMYSENYGEAFEKRSTKRVKFVIGSRYGWHSC